MNQKIMKERLLSIIVPIYNTERFLPKCLDSILRQKYSDFELILVDDGSDDGSLEICKKYQNDDERIRIIHKENGGLISAKKAGLRVAKGRYVGFVDSDDWIDIDMYSNLMEAAIKNGADIIMGDNVIEYPQNTVDVVQGIPYGLYHKEDMINIIYPNLIFKESLCELGVSPSLCTKIFIRSLVIKYQEKVDERITAGEDAACTYPCFLEAKSIEYIEGCNTYHYRIHNHSMTHKTVKMNVDEKIALLEHMYNEFLPYEYQCLNYQLYMYSAKILTDFIINCFENHISNREIKYDIEKLQNSSCWNIFKKYHEKDVESKYKKEVMDYLWKPNMLRTIRLRICVNIKSIKHRIRCRLSMMKQKMLGR